MFELPTCINRGVPPEFCFAAIFSEDQPVMVQAIERALAQNSDGLYGAEHRVRDAQGDVRWMFAGGSFEYNEAHQRPRFPGTFADITERKRGEVLLHLLDFESNGNGKKTS